MSTVQSQIEKKFEIHVKKHPRELLHHINSARKERRLCDFLIKVGSKEIPVHKIILSEGSDYFKAMFSHKMKEVESGVAAMEGVDPECMLICIEYIYTGKVYVPESKVQPLLQVASMLQLTRLCEVIGAFLETNLDPDSFFLAIKIANTFNLQGLKDHCEKYALENFNSIIVKEGFKDSKTEFAKFLIENKETKAPEAAKCKALILWANHDREKRSKMFEDIFQNLQFAKIPATYRHYLAVEEPLVSESLCCLRKLFASTDVGKAERKDFEVKGGKQENAIAVFDKNSKSIQAFNPEDKTWKQVGVISDNVLKAYFSATVIEENILIFANDKTNYKLNYTDPDAKWIQLPNRTATDQVVAVSLHNEVYAFHDGGTSGQTIEKLDIEQTSWSKMTKPFPCFHAAVIAVDGNVYTFGGHYGGSNLNKASKFDPGTKTWSDLPAMPTARHGAGSNELNGKVFVIGGHGRSNYLKTAECFNIESATWTTMKSMSYQHGYFNASTVNGKIYAVGGNESQNSIEEYDPDTNAWKTIDMMTGKNIQARATISISI